MPEIDPPGEDYLEFYPPTFAAKVISPGTNVTLTGYGAAPYLDSSDNPQVKVVFSVYDSSGTLVAGSDATYASVVAGPDGDTLLFTCIFTAPAAGVYLVVAKPDPNQPANEGGPYQHSPANLTIVTGP